MTIGLCVAGTAAMVALVINANQSAIPVHMERAATHKHFPKQVAADQGGRDGVTRCTDEQFSGSDYLQSPALTDFAAGECRGSGTPAIKRSSSREECPPARLATAPADSFFLAIREEESRDGKIPVGDGGKSRGDYHITRAYWTDACEAGGVNWDYEILVWSNRHCEQVMVWYWQRYCPDALQSAIHNPQSALETLARIHNGGPKGRRKAATLEYWRRIKKHMAAEKRLEEVR